MHDLPTALRRTLVLYFLCGLGVALGQLWVAGAYLQRWHSVQPRELWQPVVFAVLTIVIGRTSVRLAGGLFANLNTAVTVGAVLLFPMPIPFLIALP